MAGLGAVVPFGRKIGALGICGGAWNGGPAMAVVDSARNSRLLIMMTPIWLFSFHHSNGTPLRSNPRLTFRLADSRSSGGQMLFPKRNTAFR